MTDALRPITGLRPHPRADVVPALDPDQYNELVEDIERRGVVVPLDILDDGTVVDGRTRLAIARTLGLAELPVRVIGFDSEAEAFEYMVLAALHRRHLSKSQRAALALTLPMYAEARAEAAERERSGKAADPSALVREGREAPRHSKAVEVAAATAGVSPRLIEQAEQVRRVAPDRVPDIIAGRETIGSVLRAAEAQIAKAPEVREADRAARFAKAMQREGEARYALSAEHWQEGLSRSDIQAMSGHLVVARMWIEEWERALAAHRPLRAVGGDR